jgi:DNA segregation ATPase FtsK/SpoIIIE-like protein
MNSEKPIEYRLTELLKDLPPSTRLRIVVDDLSIAVDLDFVKDCKTSSLRHRFCPGEDSILRVVSRFTKLLTEELAVRENQRRQWLDSQSDNPETERLIEQCLEIIRQEKRASPSLFQRRLDLDYQRARQLVEILEHRGILGPSAGAQSRTILKSL